MKEGALLGYKIGFVMWRMSCVIYEQLLCIFVFETCCN